MIWGSVAEIWPFSHFPISFCQQTIVQSWQWPYLCPWVSNQKNKGTFFSLTFKVGEKKVPLVFCFEAQGLIYGHFLIFTTSFHKQAIVQSRTWLYLSPWASNTKTKGTFFSPTLKVKEKKVPLFFLFEAQELRYGHFLLWTIARLWNDVVKIRKWQYLSPWASNQKTKGTFFSPTLKVKKKKVPLFFWFDTHGLRYVHCQLCTIVCWENDIGKRENGHISAPEPQIKKIKALSILQLWKLKKIKCLYFLDLWLKGWDMVILLFSNMIV